MSATPYYRSPLLTWVFCVATLGIALLWIVPRLGNDLNRIIGFRAVDVSFFSTLMWLLFGAHVLVTLLIMSARAHGVDFDFGEGAGLFAARRVIDAAWLLSIVFGLRAVHYYLSLALGERPGLFTPAYIVVLTVAFLLSIPYLQDRLNLLSKGPLEEGAPA